MDLKQMNDKSIGERYLHNLCSECKETIQAAMEKANRSKFPRVATARLMTTLHSKLCKDCKLKVYNQARTDKTVRRFK